MDSTCDAMTSTGFVYAARVPGSWPERAAAAGLPAPLKFKSTGDWPVAAAADPSTRRIVGAPPLGPIVSSNDTLPPSSSEEKSFGVVTPPCPFLPSTALTTCEICAAPLVPCGTRSSPTCTRLSGHPPFVLTPPTTFPTPCAPVPCAVGPLGAAAASGGRCTSKIVSPSVSLALSTR